MKKRSQYSNLITSLACLLVMTVPVWAQKAELANLRTQFIRYQENALQEKLFVHTSKDNFFPGETMFFKIYSIDGSLHQPLKLNRVAYFELINSSKHSVAQIKVAMNDGMGNGSLVIPDSLTTGRYRIMAYTSWMRNFSEDFFFSKDILVINPLKKTMAERKLDTIKPIIRFFPEGGSLVNGLTSLIAFQATNANGQGLDCQGVVVDEKSDSVVKFQSLKFGIGTFSFTPQKGKIYRAVIHTKAGTITQELPSAYEEGYVMGANSDAAGRGLDITVASNKPSAFGKEVHLFIHSRQRIRKQLTGVMDTNGRTQFTVPTEELENGISHVTLFDSELNPLAERLYFRQPTQLLKVQASSNKSIYSKRESASLNLTTQSPNHQLVPANLSLSLYKIDDIQGYDSLSIISYLLLTSDLKGRIENPAYYLSSAGDEKIKAIDNLMLTHGWTRFTWTDVLKSKWPLTPFNPDHEGMTIRARVTDNQENPIANASVLLSTVSKGNQLYAGTSNAKGVLTFYTRNLYGQNEITLQQIGKTTNSNITPIDPFAESYSSHAFQPYTVSRIQETSIRTYSIHNQVQKGFHGNSLPTIQFDTVPAYGLPDKSYLLSDYVKFPLIKDVLAEYVFEVIVRKRESKFQLFTLNKVTQQFFESEPLILLDGVPIFDSDRIVTLQASQIKKLDVINRKIFYGAFVFSGIVSLTSHTGKISGSQMNPEAVVFDYVGLQRPQEFYVPLEEQSMEDRLPDFRNVLLWSPNIKTDVTGKCSITFSTSDLPGQYIGVINGITKNGLPGSTTFTIEVR